MLQPAMLQSFFQLDSYGITMGRAKTQLTDSVWPPTFHLCLACNDRQWRVYFQGEYFFLSQFYKCFQLHFKFIFQLNTAAQPQEWLKVSPQNEFVPCQQQ